MSVTAPDLLQPKGDLSPELFPGMDPGEVQTLLESYVADGAASSPSTLSGGALDLALKAYAYARAYRNVALRLSRDPATNHLEGEASSTVTGEQIRTFKAEADRWAAEFVERTTGEAGAGSHDNLGGTHTLSNVFVY